MHEVLKLESGSIRECFVTAIVTRKVKIISIKVNMRYVRCGGVLGTLSNDDGDAKDNA